MGKRLNDTQAITRLGASDEYHSVSVRKIDNGHIVCHSGDGEYRETYMKQAPRIIPPRVVRGEAPDDGSRCLREAMAEAEKR